MSLNGDAEVGAGDAGDAWPAGVGALVASIEGGGIDPMPGGNEPCVGRGEAPTDGVAPLVGAEVSRLLAGICDGAGLAQAQQITNSSIATIPRRMVNTTCRSWD